MPDFIDQVVFSLFKIIPGVTSSYELSALFRA